VSNGDVSRRSLDSSAEPKRRAGRRRTDRSSWIHRSLV